MVKASAENCSLYNIKKNELITLMTNACQVIEKLGITSLGSNLEKFCGKLSSSVFKIMVVGDFNAGKSTLLNGLLGDCILPTSVLECTAVITEVKYSEKKYAILYFKNPIPDYNEYDYIAPIAKAHIEKYKGTEIPELKLSIEEIDEFLIIPRNEETLEAKDIINESPFERMELFWPCEMCKNGIEIIDSPGLNATEAKEKITTAYLDEIDSLVFVLSASQLCKKNETDFIENKLKARGFEYTFFIVNKLNFVNGSRNETAEEGRQKVLHYALSKLKDKTKFGNEGIIPVNAYNAEQGRINNDISMINESGIIQFEEKLWEFLTNERGKVKLSHPARELKNIALNVLVNIIPNQLKLNEDNLENVIKKFNEIKPALVALETRRKEITAKMNNRIADKAHDLKRFFDARYRQISDNLYSYIDQVDIKKKLSLIPFKTKKSAKAILQELIEKLQPIIANEQQQWVKYELEPYVMRMTENFNDDFEVQLKAICTEIDELKLNISPEVEGSPNTFDKVMGVALGLLCHDLVVGTIGGTLGWKSALGNLGIQVGVLTGMLVLGITNPVTIIPVLIASGILQLIIGAKGFSKNIITKAKPKIKESFDAKIPSEINNNTKRILDNFYKQTNVFATVLDDEINVIKEQFETAIKEKEEVEDSVAKRKKKILNCENEFKLLKKDVEDFIAINDINL